METPPKGAKRGGQPFARANTHTHEDSGVRPTPKPPKMWGNISPHNVGDLSPQNAGILAPKMWGAQPPEGEKQKKVLWGCMQTPKSPPPLRPSPNPFPGFVSRFDAEGSSSLTWLQP